MADMIDAKDAKQKLGCDDATLQSHVNNGTIRAQRVGGKLMLNAEDVAKLAAESGGGGDDDGTIVLTGDSDDLSIDLGKVVDDSAETIVQSKKGGTASDSITFGDELEVVSFDDNTGTSELNFDDTKQTGKAGNLSFTDSNTAVMTAVDETAVGSTTAPLDFQTNPEQQAPRSGKSESSRRSVRSGRAVVESAPVHWIWPTLLGVTVAIGVFFIIPFYVVSAFAVPDEKNPHHTGRLVGVDAGYTSGLAGGLAGFTVEPSKEKFIKGGGADGDYKPMTDPQAKWRYLEFRDKFKEKDEGVERFIIDSYDAEAKTAKGKHGSSYPIKERSTTVPGTDQPIVEPYVEAYPSAK
jgi:hypothetical protein